MHPVTWEPCQVPPHSQPAAQAALQLWRGALGAQLPLEAEPQPRSGSQASLSPVPARGHVARKLDADPDADPEQGIRESTVTAKPLIPSVSVFLCNEPALGHW